MLVWKIIGNWGSDTWPAQSSPSPPGVCAQWGEPPSLDAVGPSLGKVVIVGLEVLGLAVLGVVLQDLYPVRPHLCPYMFPRSEMDK